MVGAGGGYDAGIGGESSVSSRGGGAMAAPGRIRRAKRRRQWWAMGRTKGGLKADPGRAAVSTAPFPELASESAAISWADDGFGAEKESMVSPYGPRRRKSPCRACGRMVAEEAGGTGGRAHPSRCPAWKVRGLRFGGAEPMVMVGLKGRETDPSKPITGVECSHSLRGR